MKRRRRFLAGGQQTNLLLLGGRVSLGVLLSLSFPPFLPVCMHWWAERKGEGMSAHFFHRGLGATIGTRDSPVLFWKKSTKNNFTCETVFSSLLVYFVGDSYALFHFLDGGARHGVSSCLEKEGKEETVSLSPRQSLHSYFPFPQAEKRTNRNVWKGFFSLGKGPAFEREGKKKTVGWRRERIMAP